MSLLKRGQKQHEQQLREAQALDRQIEAVCDQGNDAEAIPLYERALQLREAALGPDHPDVAANLNNFAVLYQSLGRYAEAVPLLQRALQILEKASGPHHLDTANGLNNLAVLYETTGRYPEAGSLFRRALAIREEALGGEHPDTATSLNNLAVNYQTRGRFAEAEPLFARALAIDESVHGPDHPSVARDLVNLARLCQATGRYPEAGRLFQRSLAILEESKGPDHPDTSVSLNNLAFFYTEMGRYPEAEPLFRRALEIREKSLGADHPATATSLSNLGFFYQTTGRHAEAEPLHRRALEIREQVLGCDHPDTASSLNNLAYTCTDLGQHEEALDLASRSARTKIENLRRMLNYATEDECLAYAAGQYFYNLPGQLGAADLAAEVQLQTKGLVVDGIDNRRRLEASLAGDSEAQDLLREREQLSAGYRKLLLEQGEGGEAVGGIQERIDDLDKLINLRLQTTAAAGGLAGEGLQLVPPAVDLADVRAALPQGARLLQGFSYVHLIQEEPGVDIRYAWTVVGPTGTAEPAFVRLGSALEIDETIAGFRAFFQGRQRPDSPGGASIREACEALYRLLWLPLEEAVVLGDDVTTVIICVDSQLHFVPFGTLVRPEEGKESSPRFLCQDYAIRYVDSGRELVADVPPRAEGTARALLVGNPDYRQTSDAPESGLRDAAAAPPMASIDPGRIRQNLETGMSDDTRGLYFGALPGTADEVRQLGALLQESNYEVTHLDESGATELALRAAVRRPSILHLATHGFFLRQPEPGDAPPAARSPDQRSTELRPDTLARVQDPMLRSGLALAGAQNTLDAWQLGECPDPASDGILLAAEAASLDLRGTELVVLSACSTAEGKALDGEGVVGLRRALAVAGARTVVMSLWPVDDAATVELMERFYRRFLGGMHPAAALDETSRELLVERVESEGLLRAIQRYGPFIATSQGTTGIGAPAT